MTEVTDVEAPDPLSADEWETRLVAHYLRSDGPLGGSPMTFIDATPAEIATAGGMEHLGEENAQAAFLSHFNIQSIAGWLSGKYGPSTTDKVLPGYFRYLVLTALVSATETGAGNTQNFRIRLGELFKIDKQFSSVSAVNSLWRSLVEWCERKRNSGRPYRQIQLPSYGTANLIGYAVKIAFPSWQDRSILTQTLRSLDPAIRRSPDRLTRELMRSRYTHVLPPAVAMALQDFNRAIRARQRMLLGHRFWRLIESIDAKIGNEDRTSRTVSWRLQVRFEGYEQDVVQVALLCEKDLRSWNTVWEGVLQELDQRPEMLPEKLATALHGGVLILTEAPGLVWITDEESPPEDAFAVLLARGGSIPKTWPLKASWRPVGGQWFASERLDEADLRELRVKLGLQPVGEARLVDLTFIGGIKTDRGIWLGRPGFLPEIAASTASKLAVVPVDGARGLLRVDGSAPSWKLSADEPLSGRWRIRITEGENETEKVVSFEAMAREREDFPDLGHGLELERDLAFTGVSHQQPRPSGEWSSTISFELEHVLEALCAGPRRGWGEADLIRLLQPVMPHRHFIWDFLRSLAEAGWLDPILLKSWGARIWRLRPPSLRQISPDQVVVAGAVGAVMRSYLNDIALAAGGKLGFLGANSPWAVPLPVIEGVGVDVLAKELQWPIVLLERPSLEPSPKCWPVEPRSGIGRQLHGIWSFKIGLFLKPDVEPEPRAVSLEWLVRERSDDRAVYRIVDRDETFMTTSRVAAILEAHRRLGHTLFKWEDGRFRRLGRSGHLPLEVARYLVARTSMTSGPVIQPDGNWTYEYPADPQSADWTARTFGSALKYRTAADESDLLKRTVEHRRGGGRFVWSSAAFPSSKAGS